MSLTPFIPALGAAGKGFLPLFIIFYRCSWVNMGDLLTADFSSPLHRKLLRFNPDDTRWEYQAEIFSELFLGFPQYKAHVSAYVERNYCIVVNDEDHSHPQALLKILKPEEVRKLNQWLVNRKRKILAVRKNK